MQRAWNLLRLCATESGLSRYSVVMRSSVSDLGAIGFAFAGFTFWVLTDTTVKLVGQSGLPPYEMVAFLGFFMAVFLGAERSLAERYAGLAPAEPQAATGARISGHGHQRVRGDRAAAYEPDVVLHPDIHGSPLISLLSMLFLREGLPWRKGWPLSPDSPSW